ncbi:thioredoxin reductase (NADPH) [Clostridium cavendishii DSM 21758]|uniref:Thioredoxin reductase (NADPH) n=1 Tax=Clostridium cavendishii DSM 21758 TaxID=1121302 RepID=A0A1M6EH52_9CLOT|nr:FAD-dependent oxidoreductase [Clostridium cavendishii]SHI84763.1 thioredoxin reductase (NADPH) [Clostridium cavendishii DSM 21758]
MDKIYDLIIIGGGAAGLSAGIYAGRAKLDTLIVEKGNGGGQAATTLDIVNYPGVRKTTGPKLMEEMKLQAEDFGVEFLKTEVLDMDLTKDVKDLKTDNGLLRTRAIIIATGASPRALGFKGEQEFKGRGVGYCSTCDGEFFKDLEVLVVGAGYAAAEEAIYLTRFAKKVIVIAREPEFTCAKSIGDKVKANPKIEVRFNTEVIEAKGDELLRSVRLINNITKEEYDYYPPKEDGTFGIFVFVGYEPKTKSFKNHVNMDEYGYIITDENMKTDVKGVYAAGDLRPKSLRQIVTAVADGAIAATDAEKYITEEKERLGIKDIEVKKVLKEEVKKESKIENKAGRSSLLNEALKNQLRPIFEKIERKVILASVVDANNAKSIELKEFILDLVELGENLEAKILNKGEDLAFEKQINADKFPVVALLNDKNEYSGVKFHGVPGGHELNSFVLAIYNYGGPGQAIDQNILKDIKAIDKKVNIKVGVSLSCTYCPDVVVAAQRIAIENPNVETEMIDLSNFEDIKNKYKLMSVPAIIINDKDVYFGAKKINEILDMVNR